MIYSESLPLPNYPKTSFEKCLFQVINQGSPTNQKDSIVVGQTPSNIGNLFQSILNWSENRICLDFLTLDEFIFINCNESEIDKAIIVMCRLKIQRILHKMHIQYNSFGFPVYLNFDADRIDFPSFDPDYPVFGMHLVHLTRIANCPVLMIRVAVSLLLSGYFEYSSSLIKCLYDVLKHTENGTVLIQTVIHYIFDHITEPHLFIYQLYKSPISYNASNEDLVTKKRQFPWYSKLSDYFKSSSIIQFSKPKLLTLSVILAYNQKYYLKSIEFISDYFSSTTMVHSTCHYHLLFKMATSYFHLNRNLEASCIAVQLIPILEYPHMQMELFKIVLDTGIPINQNKKPDLPTDFPILNKADYQFYLDYPMHVLCKLTLLYSELEMHTDFNIYFDKFVRSRPSQLRVNDFKLSSLSFHIPSQSSFADNILINGFIICRHVLLLKVDYLGFMIDNQLIKIESIEIQGPCHVPFSLKSNKLPIGSYTVDHVICSFGNTEISFVIPPSTIMIDRVLINSDIVFDFDDLGTGDPFETNLQLPNDASFIRIQNDPNLKSITCSIDAFGLLTLGFTPSGPNSHFVNLVYLVADKYYKIHYLFKSVTPLDIRVDFKFCGDALFLVNVHNKTQNDIQVKNEFEVGAPLLLFSKQTGTLACLFEEIPTSLYLFYKNCGLETWNSMKIPIIINNEMYSYIDAPGIVGCGEIFNISYWVFNMMHTSSGIIGFEFNDLKMMLISGSRTFTDEINSRKVKCYRYSVMVEESGRYKIPLLAKEIGFEEIEIIVLDKASSK